MPATAPAAVHPMTYPGTEVDGSSSNRRRSRSRAMSQTDFHQVAEIDAGNVEAFEFGITRELHNETRNLAADERGLTRIRKVIIRNEKSG